jgi:hypothetical protein
MIRYFALAMLLAAGASHIVGYDWPTAKASKHPYPILDLQ